MRLPRPPESAEKSGNERLLRMYAVRLESLGKAGPVAAEASPFHAMMADRMTREGVLRRVDGGYLLAVREADLGTLEGLRARSAGHVRVRPWDGVHLAEIEDFADVMDAEMRCTLLTFPEDFRPEEAGTDLPAASHPAPAPAASSSEAGIEAMMESLSEALGREFAASLAASVTTPAEAPVETPAEAFVAQLARDLPEIERILREAGRPA